MASVIEHRKSSRPTTLAVYVSHAESGDIRVFHLDAQSAALTEVQRVAGLGKVMPMALGPRRDRLYAARRSEPVEVLSFAVDRATGELAALGAAPLPHSMAFLATDPRGGFLLSASYGGDLIAVNPIDADGVVRAAAQQVLPTAPQAHAVQVDPSGRFVFATSLGRGVVMQFRFDAGSGRLTPNTPPAMRPHAGASPRHFVFGPGARVVYLLGERDAAIDVLAFDAATGTLRTVQTVDTVPAGFVGDAWAADLHLTPDGQFLYRSERRSNTIAGFRVDAGSGRLTPLGQTPTEPQPRGFQVTPDGRFLVAAGEASHRLRVYRIDADSGGLLAIGDHATGQGPNWIESIVLAR